MTKKKFTEEEIAILAANPYTFMVTTNQISFTGEFKELFWLDYQNRMSSTQIFRKYGYDPDMIGLNRITGFQQYLRKEAEAGLEFCSGRRLPGARKKLIVNVDSDGETLRDLQQRVDYLEQEVDFLKKISSVRTSKK